MTNFIKQTYIQKEFKKTIFQSYIDLNGKEEDTFQNPHSYTNVQHLGYSEYYKNDLFKCWMDRTNDFNIFFGVAGDEFN
jgi:hypothetical protein